MVGLIEYIVSDDLVTESRGFSDWQIFPVTEDRNFSGLS